MKNFTFPEKKQLRAGPICRIGRALYAKTSLSYLYHFGMRGVLSPPGICARILGAKATVCLYRCFREEAVGGGRGQILSKKNYATGCRGFEDRSKTAPRGDQCPGARPRALAFEMLAFCQGSARCCGRGEIPAANNGGEAGRSGPG